MASSGQQDHPLRVRAEQAEGRLHEVLSNMPVAYIAIDRNWIIVQANRHAAIANRMGMEEFVGKNLWTLWPELLGTEVELQYKRAMESRISVRFEHYNPCYQAWFDLSVHPVHEGIGVYYEDSTMRRRAQQAFRESERLDRAEIRERTSALAELKNSQHETERQKLELESLYRTAPIGLALFDPVEFRYLRLNDRQAEIVGLPMEKILGRTVTEIAPGIEGLHEMFQQAARGEPIRNKLLEGELPSRPGVYRYWTVNYDPVYAPDGTIRAIAAASLEITAQKRAEQALIQSEKLAAVGRLASSISHEINNPLEAVTNLLYLATSLDNLSHDLREYLNTAQKELARVSQISTQSLRFHRQTMNPTMVSTAELINSVLDLYRGRLMNSNIRVETKYTSATRIFCFENDIRQVLNNLIANAFDSMRGGGRLLLRTHDAIDPKTGKRGVRLAIADSGHGISLESQGRLFEAFYTTKDLNGTGLGLWISRGIAARHHGHLSFRSSTIPGRSGTVFTLFLPARDIPDAPL